MAYGRRRKYNKRPRRSKRRFRNKTSSARKRSRFRQYITDILSPPRTWHNDIDVSLNLNQNKYYWYAPTSHCSTTQLEEAWKDTGEGGVALVSSIPKDTERAIMKLGSTRMEVNNLNTHPIFVEVYWLTARDRITAGATSAHVKAIEYLVDGWKDRMLLADETDIDTTEGTNVVTTLTKTLNPLQSYRLRMAFKIKKGKGGWIRPGGVVNFTYKSTGDRSIRYEIIKNDSNHQAIPGLTVVPLFRIVMASGVKALDPSVFRPMDGYFHCKVHKIVKFKFVDLKPALMAIKNDKSTTTGEVLVGPSEFEDKADE